MSPLFCLSVWVTLSVLGTRSLDGKLGGTEPMGSAGTPVGGSAYARVGRFDESGEMTAGLCLNGTGTPGSREESIREAPHAWLVSYELVDRQIDRVTLEVKWEYLFSKRRGQLTSTRGDTRVVTLEEGQRHVLDYLKGASESSCARDVLIEVSTTVTEDPALADTLLRYDVWLEHSGAGDRSQSRHFEAIGRQGEEIDFRFLPLRFPVPDQRLGDSNLETTVDVYGAFRSRLRPDGSIDLVLDASRWIDVAREGQLRSGGVGDGGSKTFSVTPGETIRLAMPAPFGHVSMTESSKTVSRESVADATPSHSVKIDLEEFFADDTESLILTVTPER